MNRYLRTAFVLVVFLAVVSAGSQRPSPTRPTNFSSFAGVWRGEMDGLPAITLVISDDGGSPTGAVLFYLHTRKTENDPWTSTPGLPGPIFNIHFDGNMITFQVSHRLAHPPGTLNDPPVTMQLTLTGNDQASFSMGSEHGAEKGSGPGFVMTRSDY
jgi:hypothetical protein